MRLFVLIYFKLGKAEEGWGRGPSASMGREEGGALFFTLTFFSTQFSLFLLLHLGPLGVSVISPFGPLDCLFFVC